MEHHLLQKLTSSELDRYLREIDQAIEMHVHWLENINQSLICHTPPTVRDICSEPHKQCNFGRWYNSVDSQELRQLEAFIAIDEVHRVLHASAREMLLQDQRRIPISSVQYERFSALSNTLRYYSDELRHIMRSDRGLVSRLMLKVFENANEGVIITDPQAYILSINDSFTRTTGYSAEEVVGQRPSLLKSDRQDSGFYRQMWQQLNDSGHWEGEIWNRRKNGVIYLEWLSISAVNDEDSNITHYVGIFSDITKTREHEQQLRYLAHYDQLTQLPNRTLFQDRLHQALAMAKREHHQVALMFLDLDGFKAVNDTLGHNAGDELLRQVAQRLQSNLRESDTASRFGGDEFTILLPEITQREGLASLAAKLVEAIARPYDINGASARVTTSIGISLYPEPARNSEQLIKQADSAMYHAKSHGKNHYEFYTAQE